MSLVRPAGEAISPESATMSLSVSFPLFALVLLDQAREPREVSTTTCSWPSSPCDGRLIRLGMTGRPRCDPARHGATSDRSPSRHPGGAPVDEAWVRRYFLQLVDVVPLPPGHRAGTCARAPRERCLVSRPCGGCGLLERSEGATVASSDSVNEVARIQRPASNAGLAQNLSVFTEASPSVRVRRDRYAAGRPGNAKRARSAP